MPRRRSGVHWYYDTLTPGLATFAVKANSAIDQVVEQYADQVQEYAQQHAPWDDRTGDARSGLTAEAGRSGFKHTITLYHTADYGLYLEVRWSGRYAIIIPTIEVMGPRLMLELQGVMAVV